MSGTKDRKKARSIVRFPGKIVSNDLSVDCMLVDFSVTGARIHLSEADSLPQKFMLQISLMPELHPIILKVRRVWRNRDLAGIHFESLSRRDYSVIDSIVKIHRGEMKQP